MSRRQGVIEAPDPLALAADGLSHRERGLWSDAWRRLTHNRLAMIGLAVLCSVAILAFVGSTAGPTGRYSADDQSTAKQAAPELDHWFGTDQLGRDLFARVLEGVRISLQIGIGAELVILIVGIAVGGAAALGGRVGNNILMRFTDVIYAFPDLLFIILLRSVLTGRDLPIVTSPRLIVIFAIGLVNWTTTARLVRGQMLSLATRDFVIAAHALGATRTRIVMQHMLPNTLGPIIVAATFGIPAAIFAEAALSFIGLGVPPPASSLGSLVSAGYAVIQRNVWNVVFPAGAIAVLMLCFTFIGDGLRDALDPRTRG